MLRFNEKKWCPWLWNARPDYSPHWTTSHRWSIPGHFKKLLSIRKSKESLKLISTWLKMVPLGQRKENCWLGTIPQTWKTYWSLMSSRRKYPISNFKCPVYSYIQCVFKVMLLLPSELYTNTRLNLATTWFWWISIVSWEAWWKKWSCTSVIYSHLQGFCRRKRTQTGQAPQSLHVGITINKLAGALWPYLL